MRIGDDSLPAAFQTDEQVVAEVVSSNGVVLRKETGLTTPKIVRLAIGNPLVMKEMAKHVPEAGAYAPVTVLW